MSCALSQIKLNELIVTVADSVKVSVGRLEPSHPLSMFVSTADTSLRVQN